MYCSKKKFQYDDAVTSRGQTSTMPPLPNGVVVSRGWLTGSDITNAIGNDIAYANCGKISIQGNTKYGFFPKLNRGRVTTEWWSPNLVGGYTSTLWTWD
jgi:hypothetical protein